MTNKEAARILEKQKYIFSYEWGDIAWVNQAYNMAITLLDKHREAQTILDIIDITKDKKEVKIHRCPLCKSNNLKISLTEEYQGMDGFCRDWYIVCQGCGIMRISLAADNFYGREYYKTKDDAIRRWNEICNEYDPVNE